MQPQPTAKPENRQAEPPVNPTKLFQGIQQAAREAEQTDDPRVRILATDALIGLIGDLDSVRKLTEQGRGVH